MRQRELESRGEKADSSPATRPHTRTPSSPLLSSIILAFIPVHPPAKLGATNAEKQAASNLFPPPKKNLPHHPKISGEG